MFRMRSLVAGLIRNRAAMARVATPMHNMQIVRRHGEGPPQIFSNMPFRFHNRYTATLVFSLFFGSGLWAPFLLIWYAMAKRTL